MLAYLRSRLALCSSTWAWEICFWASRMPSSSVWTLDSSSLALACMSDFRSSVFALVISFCCSSALHQSTFFTSSACWVFRVAIMSSIAFFTFVKASSSTEVARIDSWGLCAFFATSRSLSAARLRFTSTSFACWMKLYVPVMASRASSSVRIWMVCATASISCMRNFLRSSKFLSAVSQVAFMLSRNFWFSDREASSWARSSFASARLLVAVASSSSFCSSIFSPASISMVLAERSSSNASERAASAFCASPRSACISSCSCLRMPTISPL
mmetsp:Transcript_87133/g.230709  ORF Transcript_87133/g.230709 Transcript_87133/m.230709 type:complete len:272 (-) Transcript_87133:970-1785(-)